jgi:hypothetical protein
VASIGLPVLIAWATGTLDFLLLTLKKPMPIWAIIPLGLLVYACLELRKPRSLSTPSYKIKYFKTDNYKWKVKVFRDTQFQIIDENFPICSIHDLRFIHNNDKMYCHAPGCKNELEDSKRDKVIAIANSTIESKIRNKDY